MSASSLIIYSKQRDWQRKLDFLGNVSGVLKNRRRKTCRRANLWPVSCSGPLAATDTMRKPAVRAGLLDPRSQAEASNRAGRAWRGAVNAGILVVNQNRTPLSLFLAVS